MFADENGIESDCVVSPVEFATRFQQIRDGGTPISAVVLMDDIAATGQSLSGNIATFLGKHIDLISSTRVRVMTIVATPRAEATILDSLSEIDLDVDFRTCETLPKEHYALPDDKSGFSSEVEWERAKTLCESLGVKIDRKRPMGYGEMGLLVVFPTNVPNNTLPILRSHSRGSSGGKWVPLFERVTH